jgi:two-component system, response regulator
MTRRPRTVSGLVLPIILLVEEDEDVHGMVRDALLEGAKPSVLRTVRGLLLVDLDLPADGGIAAIRTAKQGHARIPVVALTQRPDPDRTAAAYDAGANTVIPRPVTFLALVRLMKVFTAYWLEAAELPREEVA